MQILFIFFVIFFTHEFVCYSQVVDEEREEKKLRNRATESDKRERFNFFFFFVVGIYS
jgi:hypothetical protein